MAEHPGAPHTPGTPEPSDDDLSPAAFDGLGLGSLSDDVRPTRAQWSAMVVEASERRATDRRPWLISAAAAVMLIVAVTGLLVARSGREDVIAGSGSGSLPVDVLPRHLLPPADAQDIEVAIGLNGASISYRVDGEPFGLAQWLAQPTADGQALTNEDLATAGAVPVDGGPQGQVWANCAERVPYVDESGRETDGGTSASASWVTDGVHNWLAVAPQRGAVTTESCADLVPKLGAWVSELRLATPSEWAEFLSTHKVTPLPDEPATTPATSAPTTLPEDPPADRASAEDQIRAAAEDWQARDADGSFVHLEAGTEKAAEYAGMFDTAAKQSGAAQAGDGSENRNTVTTIRFVTPERAAITMSLTAKLPTGTYTFTQEGEAILQDGRWVVTYRTVTTTLGRACTPPGGYDGCP